MKDCLQQAREVINEVDAQMAELFEKRMAAVQQVLAYKMCIRDRNYLSETMPKCPLQTDLRFSWNPMRGQDYCCPLYTSRCV